MDPTMEMPHHHHEGSYEPPLALTILSAVFLGLGAICGLVIVGDIVWRRGWRSMMGVMVPVHPINATYMLPVSMWLYFTYGRPISPSDATGSTGEHCHHPSSERQTKHRDQELGPHACCKADAVSPDPASRDHRDSAEPQSASPCCSNKDKRPYPADPIARANSDSVAEKGENAVPSCHAHAASRPMYATVLAGVSHCGAGCVLGDIVGEWLVYGANITIDGEMLWAALLIDYAFALLFGVAFQYFSIGPMSGEYGPKTIWRAAKADILSLTSFEVGAFGWMIIYQAGIFDYKLSMMTWTYWWMMQVGMAFGFATAVPVNWWLLTKGIKEPCC